MAAIAENAGGELMQDSVSQTLAIEMLDGIWQAGDSLTLEDMQSRFGISRTVAREVAKTLESLSAVWVRRRVGLVARPFSEWQALNRQVIEWRLHSTQREQQLYSLTELRLAVEPAAAASAARPDSHPSTSRQNSPSMRHRCVKPPKPVRKAKTGSPDSTSWTWNSTV